MQEPPQIQILIVFCRRAYRTQEELFLSSKSQMANRGLKHIHFMEMHNIKIATFRCNNTGENIKF